ncbi:outer membrane protein [Pontibacter burrus]|uniref:Outer membrane beta-barrel protein n=1 Tax=Pontibacter burrus TaxID=2704466 RepID=A0A6B3LYJ4_9BACT|nr:outer membrane beta-barrel protein [Pontibacter burrus]NEM98541.1 outer membrane beta-barrel protein [Pontibacter burrus]
MKKLFTIAVFALLGTGAFAQTSKGTIAVSARVSLNNSLNKTSYSDENYKSDVSGFSFSGSFGYFIKDNVMVSPFIGYEYYNSLSTNDNSNSSYSRAHHRNKRYSAGASLSKYYMLSERIAVTGSGAISLYKGTDESTYDSNSIEDYKDKSKGFAISVSPGIAFFPTDRIELSTSFGRLSYNRSLSERTRANQITETTSSKLGFNLSSNTITLGVGYHFNH